LDQELNLEEHRAVADLYPCKVIIISVADIGNEPGKSWTCDADIERSVFHGRLCQMQRLDREASRCLLTMNPWTK